MERPDVSAYQVGILCALHHEFSAVLAAFDIEHDIQIRGLSRDDNVSSYVFGSIGPHNVVAVCLPEGMTGKAAAATVSKDLMRSFPTIKVGLLVGVGGGAPNKTHDIRLGDVVVAQPSGDSGGVVQYDFGKQHPNGFRATGTLNKPPIALMAALSRLKAAHGLKGRSRLADHLKRILAKLGDDCAFPGIARDLLFESCYDHVGSDEDPCNHAESQCDLTRLKQRAERKDLLPMVFYGNVASGDQVMRSGSERDRIAGDRKAICFEMEAAGLENSFPCIVIRGICDYADSHKDKVWQKYAAATAASFAKEFLHFVVPTELDLEKPLGKQALIPQGMTGSFSGPESEEPTMLELVPRRFQFAMELPSGLRGVPEIGHFVSREAEMNQMEAYFDSGRSSSRCRRTFVVHGMGGIGKTQLCIAFALRSRTRFKHVFWLDGSSKRSVLQSLANSASSQLGLLMRRTFSVWMPAHEHGLDMSSSLHHIVDQFTEWLSAADNQDWLLIIDNVDRDWRGGRDPEAFDYRKLLPKSQHGNVLITTRLADLQIPLASLQLAIFNDAQALELLQTRAGKMLPDAARLIERLGRLPLAVAQAGAYLGRTSMTVEKYLELYETTWAKLVESQQKIRTNSAVEMSLLATWNMSYDQVAEENPTAAGLLLLWAFMGHHKLWFDLCDGEKLSPADFSWPRWFKTIIGDGIAFRDSMQVLVSFSLVYTSANEEEAYNMHSVLHDWTLHHAQDDPQKSTTLFMMAAGLVASACEEVTEKEVEGLLPHARRVAEMQESRLGSQTADWLKTIAEFLAAHGACSDAESLLIKVQSFYEEEWGLADEHSLGIIIALGGLYTRQSKPDLAEQVYRASWSSCAHTKPRKRTLDLMRIAYALADIHIDKEEWHDAEVLLLACQEWTEEASRSREIFALETMQRLGHVYWMQDRHSEAEAMWLRALHLSPQGKGDETTIDIRSNLADMYKLDRSYAKAEAMYRACDDISTETFGQTHTITLTTKSNLASFLQERGRYQAVEEVWQQAYYMCQHVQDNNQSLSYRKECEAVLSSKLAWAHLLRGKLQAAHGILRLSIDVCKQTYGSKHSTTLMLLGRLHAIRDNIMYTSRHRISEHELQQILAQTEGSGDPNLLIRTEVEKHIEVRDARSRRALSKIPIRAQYLIEPTSPVKRPRYHGLTWAAYVAKVMSLDEPVWTPDSTNLYSLLQQRVLIQLRRRGGLWKVFADMGIWHGSQNRQRRQRDVKFLRQLFSVPNVFLHEVDTIDSEVYPSVSSGHSTDDGLISSIYEPGYTSIPTTTGSKRSDLNRHGLFRTLQLQEQASDPSPSPEFEHNGLRDDVPFQQVSSDEHFTQEQDADSGFKTDRDCSNSFATLSLVDSKGLAAKYHGRDAAATIAPEALSLQAETSESIVQAVIPESLPRNSRVTECGNEDELGSEAILSPRQEGATSEETGNSPTTTPKLSFMDKDDLWPWVALTSNLKDETLSAEPQQTQQVVFEKPDNFSGTTSPYAFDHVKGASDQVQTSHERSEESLTAGKGHINQAEEPLQVQSPTSGLMTPGEAGAADVGLLKPERELVTQASSFPVTRGEDKWEPEDAGPDKYTEKGGRCRLSVERASTIGIVSAAADVSSNLGSSTTGDNGTHNAVDPRPPECKLEEPGDVEETSRSFSGSLVNLGNIRSSIDDSRGAPDSDRFSKTGQDAPQESSRMSSNYGGWGSGCESCARRGFDRSVGNNESQPDSGCGREDATTFGCIGCELSAKKDNDQSLSACESNLDATTSHLNLSTSATVESNPTEDDPWADFTSKANKRTAKRKKRMLNPVVEDPPPAPLPIVTQAPSDEPEPVQEEDWSGWGTKLTGKKSGKNKGKEKTVNAPELLNEDSRSTYSPEGVHHGKTSKKAASESALITSSSAPSQPQASEGPASYAREEGQRTRPAVERKSYEEDNIVVPKDELTDCSKSFADDTEIRARALNEAWSSFEAGLIRPRLQKRTTFNAELEYIPTAHVAGLPENKQKRLARNGMPLGHGSSLTHPGDGPPGKESPSSTSHGQYKATVKDAVSSIKLDSSHEREPGLGSSRQLDSLTEGDLSGRQNGTHHRSASMETRSGADGLSVAVEAHTRTKKDKPAQVTQPSRGQHSRDTTKTNAGPSIPEKRRTSTRRPGDTSRLAATDIGVGHEATARQRVISPRLTQSHMAFDGANYAPTRLGPQPYLWNAGAHVFPGVHPYYSTVPFRLPRLLGDVVAESSDASGRRVYPNSRMSDAPLSSRHDQHEPHMRRSKDKERQVADQQHGHHKARGRHKVREVREKTDVNDSSRRRHERRADHADNVVIVDRNGTVRFRLSRREFKSLARQLDESDARKRLEAERRSVASTANELPNASQRSVRRGASPRPSHAVAAKSHSPQAADDRLGRNDERRKGLEVPEAPMPPEEEDLISLEDVDRDGIGHPEPRAPPSSSYPSFPYGKSTSEEKPLSSLYGWDGVSDQDFDAPFDDRSNSKSSPAQLSTHPCEDAHDGLGSPPKYWDSDPMRNRYDLMSSDIPGREHELGYGFNYSPRTSFDEHGPTARYTGPTEHDEEGRALAMDTTQASSPKLSPLLASTMETHQSVTAESQAGTWHGVRITEMDDDASMDQQVYNVQFEDFSDD